MAEGYVLEPIGEADALAIVDQLRALRLEERVVSLLAKCRSTGDERLWVLIHADAGVTWGTVEGANVKLSSKVFPQWPTPEPEAAHVQQLRVFGRGGELLLWRDDGTRRLAGRILIEASFDGPPYLMPRRGVRFVAASHLADGGATREGFTAVADGTGRTQVVPWALKEDDFPHREGRSCRCLVLEVLEYFERDKETGSVRLEASRLVRLAQREYHKE